jgi:hypothetical protein
VLQAAEAGGGPAAAALGPPDFLALLEPEPDGGAGEAAQPLSGHRGPGAAPAAGERPRVVLRDAVDAATAERAPATFGTTIAGDVARSDPASAHGFVGTAMGALEHLERAQTVTVRCGVPSRGRVCHSDAPDYIP